MRLLNHIQNKLFVKVLLLLRRHSSLLSKSIPLSRIDKEEFTDIFIAAGDEALNDCRAALANRHSDYANALKMTGAELSIIRRELDLAVSYSTDSEQSIKAHALSFQWFTKGASEILLNAQENLLSTSIGDYTQLAAEYALNCIELGHQDKALAFLDSYDDREKIEYPLHLPLANAVADNFPWATKYEKHARLFKNLELTRLKFESTIKSHSTCIVGNSPIEIGRGRGAEIDTHPMVIRFNNFSTDHTHRHDYGSKTDVWVRAGSTDVRNRKISNLSFVIWEEDIWHTKLLKETSEQMLSDMEMRIPETYIPAKIHQKLRGLANSAIPSTGLSTCYWIYTLLGKLEPQQIFGFSLTDQIKNKNNKHYHQTTRHSSRILHHNWEREREILQQMLNKSLKCGH